MTTFIKTRQRIIPLNALNNLKTYSLLFLLWLGVAHAGMAQPTIDKIVAIVGDQVILKSDIEVQYQQYRAEGNATEGLRCQLLDQMLAQKLLVAQAEVDSVVVSEQEVETELDKRIRYFINMIGSEEKLEEFYQKSVIEIKEEFREDIKNQLLAQKMQGQITADVTVTPAEVKDFYNSIPEDSLPRYNAEVEVGHLIIYAHPSAKQKRAALEKIREIRQTIVDEGAAFNLKAILYSDDPGSASKGGELPAFTQDDPYDPKFIAVAFRLNEGEVSQPFETDFGYHIIELMERDGNRVKVRHILITPKITPEDMQRARAKADSIHQLIESNQLTFGQAVSRFSEDESTNKYGGMITNPNTGQTYFELDELGAIDQAIPFIIDTMEAGEVSSPVKYTDQRGNQGYRLIYLQSVTAPHIANLQDDYARMTSAALNQKKTKIMRQWLKERIQKTYIKIDESFAQCPEVKPWLSATP